MNSNRRRTTQDARQNATRHSTNATRHCRPDCSRDASLQNTPARLKLGLKLGTGRTRQLRGSTLTQQRKLTRLGLTELGTQLRLGYAMDATRTRLQGCEPPGDTLEHSGAGGSLQGVERTGQHAPGGRTIRGRYRTRRDATKRNCTGDADATDATLTETWDACFLDLGCREKRRGFASGCRSFSFPCRCGPIDAGGPQLPRHN